MDDPFSYCEDMVRAADKDRFLATLFAPAERRGALFALYAFNLEVARIREVIHEPLAGEIRLRWWIDLLEGSGHETARANPVAAALLDTIEIHGLAVKPLIDLVEARQFDLYNDPMPTMAALEIYARRTASNLIGTAMTILGDADAAAAGIAASAGIAYAMTGLLRVFALHASRGQLYMPTDLLQPHGVQTSEIFAGRSSAELRAALRELCDRAYQNYEAMRRHIDQVPAGLIPALLPAMLVPLYLDRMRSRDYDPFRSVVEVPQWRRQWVLWRTARFKALPHGARQ